MGDIGIDTDIIEYMNDIDTDITHILHNIGIDIIHIENHRIALADLGRTVFSAQLALEVPTEVSLEQLVEAVQQVEENMRVEVIH